jgi:hypothetical protein
MEFVNELFEKRNMPQLVMIVLFLVYLIMGYKMPDQMASAIDTTLGKIMVVMVSLMLFAYSNPILGVIGIMVAYQLIRSAGEKTGTSALNNLYEVDSKKWTPFTETNDYPQTLEQEVVKRMTTQKFNENYVKPPYAPLIEDTYDASFIV